MKSCDIRLFSYLVCVLLIIFMSHGCQHHISQAVANQIADTELTKTYQGGFLGHKISDAQLQNVDACSVYSILTFISKNSPGHNVLITVDSYGNILDTAFGTPEWP